MQEKTFERIVPEDHETVRLDRFWASELDGEGVSRSRVKQWIQSGEATVNGEVCPQPALQLKPGDRTSLRMRLPEQDITPETGELEIVHRDKDLLVVNKPPGLSVHPAPSCPEGTLVHRLVHRFPEMTAMEGLRPGIVHRLDKDTSGLIVVALHDSARLVLSRDFAERSVDKTYLALVHGAPPSPRGLLAGPIGRDPRNKTKMAVVHRGGRQARSEYETVWSDADRRFSLLKVVIATGRTHQIRVHLAHAGHPIVGDGVYGPAAQAGLARDMPQVARHARRQMLHAWRLSFVHPITEQRMAFVQPPPRDFRRVVLLLGRRVQRVGVTGMPGCGKSELVRRLENLGAPVWFADREVAALYEPGGDGAALLRQRFGDRFMTPDGGVNKKKLLKAMLDSDDLRREVELLVHPLVRHRLEDFWNRHSGDRWAVAEVPLLLESGWDPGELFDVVVCLHAPADLRHEWLAKSRGWSEELIARMESWQWTERDKLRQCDLPVANPGTPQGLDRVAENLATVLQALRRKTMQTHRDRLVAIWSEGVT